MINHISSLLELNLKHGGSGKEKGIAKYIKPQMCRGFKRQRHKIKPRTCRWCVHKDAKSKWNA